MFVTNAAHQYFQLFAAQNGRAALPVPLGLGGTKSSLLIDELRVEVMGHFPTRHFSCFPSMEICIVLSAWVLERP